MLDVWKSKDLMSVTLDVLACFKNPKERNYACVGCVEGQKENIFVEGATMSKAHKIIKEFFFCDMI